ncbi:AraC family transcriptional regulator [Marinomonas pollencensis]|uniref:HTH araC/xylS-type domain-containing protein n=1 Tax=Marinomonas pollencensis TaxID=491954 RepID=A0A3E0DQQ8_9GAMM|nr:AraC family transcriptional regulator [Marinomonas pollencensis]REG84221.1 hypothetical protein DFP81_104100 [Marinomonas pollencensis]
MLHINLHDAYDAQGDISSHFAASINGHKRHISLLPNLQIIDQHLSCHSETRLTEQAQQGFYFSLIGSQPIDSIEQVESIQVSYQTQDIVGDFVMASGEQRSLFQIHVGTEQLAVLFNETEEQVSHYFSNLFTSLSQGSQTISLPVTEKNRAICQLMLTYQTQTLSLIGHVYSCICTFVEQLKMLNHLARCEGCQQKVFQAQNLLETPDHAGLKTDILAHRVGLNSEALTLGFQHLVGQSIADYGMRSRMQYAAAMLRQNPHSKSSVVAKSGFTESQFEAIFIQHFGVSSHQYGQIH